MEKREKFVAKTYAGLEEILLEELEQLGAENCKLSTRAVLFEGDMDTMYRANYFCRYALRILWQVGEFRFRDNKQFYEEIYKYPAEKVLKSDGTLAFSVTMKDAIFATPLFAAQLAKDAVCDRFREKCDERPSVRKENPDVQFHIHIMGDRATLFLDSSGEPLYRRGYRVASHPAQISEVIAAAMVKLSGWQHDCDLIDPMCGSGTILIEAALATLNVPAGFFRHSFGFYRWKTFDQKRWEQIQDEADIRDDVPVNFYGSDISSRFIGMAKDNIREARLTDFIRVRRSPMNESHPVRTPSFVIFNPPYGERLDIEDIEAAYKEIGDTLKQHYAGCTAFIISSNISALKSIGLHASKRITLYNGALECKFMRFDLYKGTKNSDFHNLQNENSDN
ncbi:MAG: class I SAM-dependent RNA methyltransferase [Bacteroidales bacterium]|nr:class I SAM-dependent RNA methyltransferase [Bacteroidales bacterium]